MLPQFYFETRKDAACTFNAFVRFSVDDKPIFVDYISQDPPLLFAILSGRALTICP